MGKESIDPSIFSSIARELTIAAQLADSVPAAAEAKYGLAVLHIDQSIPSNDERTNIELGLNWLQESALMGCDRARAIIYRVFRSFQKPLPQSCEQNITTWLVDTAARGFFQSLEDLRELGEDDLARKALKLLKTKYSGTGVQRFDKIFSSSIDELLESDEKTVSKLRGIHDAVKKFWKSRRGDTLLHFAASCGLLRTLQHSLASNPAALNSLNGESESPLLLACRSGHYSVVLELLASGANPRIRSERGESPFHWLTSFEGDQVREICQALLQHSDVEQLNAVADEVGYIYCRENKYIKGTPLMRAVARNRLDVVLVLLNYGANPDVMIDDSSALNLAAGLHYPEILSALLCHTTIGPGLLCPATGMSLIQAAIVGGCFERRSTFGRIRRHGPRWLTRARETMQTLVDFGSSGILERISGLPNSTVLACASAFSQVDIVEYLLRTVAKARLNSLSIIPGGRGEIKTTPVGASILAKNLQIFRLLIEQGASVKRPHPYAQSYSLLYKCADCSNDNPEFAQILIDRGVEVNETPHDFEPPFACALRNRCFKLAGCLFRNGADPGIEYSKGLLIQTSYPKSILGHLIHECSMTTLPCLNFFFEQAKSKDVAIGFTVARSIKFTALHEIASIPLKNQDDVASKLILGCILDFFKPSVEQISAPCAIQDYTALHLAITMANFPVVQGILHYGIEPSLEANEEIWGLHLAEGLRDGFLDKLLPDSLKPTNAMEMKAWKNRMNDIVLALEDAGFRKIL